VSYQQLRVENNWDYLTYYLGNQKLDEKKGGTAQIKWPDDTTETVEFVSLEVPHTTYDHGKQYKGTHHELIVRQWHKGVPVEVPLMGLRVAEVVQETDEPEPEPEPVDNSPEARAARRQAKAKQLKAARHRSMTAQFQRQYGRDATPEELTEGVDPHTATAEAIFTEPPATEEEAQARRQAAKSVNFGMLHSGTVISKAGFDQALGRLKRRGKPDPEEDTD